MLHWHHLSGRRHSHILVLRGRFVTELKLLHMWSVLVSFSAKLVFLSWWGISLKAILIDLEVAIDHTSSFFGSSSLELLGSSIIFCHKNLFVWWDINVHSVFWIIISMWAPCTALGRSFDNWWLSLVALTNFGRTRWNISNLLFNYCLRKSVRLVADKLLPLWIIVFSWRLKAFFVLWLDAIWGIWYPSMHP